MKTPRSDSVPYQLFMFGLSVLTILVLVGEIALRSSPNERELLQRVDTAICVFFLFDFFVCLYRAPNRWRYMYTWGWLDLLSSIPMLDAARWGRAARAARIFRVLRAIRASKILTKQVLAKRAQSAFLAVTLFAVLLLVVGSLSILQVETAPEANIKTADDALWWSMTTITTVGYGDRYPVSAEGRMIAAILMCAGVGLFGTFSGFLAAWFVTPATRDEYDEINLLRKEVQEIKALLENSAAMIRPQD